MLPLNNFVVHGWSRQTLLAPIHPLFWPRSPGRLLLDAPAVDTRNRATLLPILWPVFFGRTWKCDPPSTVESSYLTEILCLRAGAGVGGLSSYSYESSASWFLLFSCLTSSICFMFFACSSSFLLKLVVQRRAVYTSLGRTNVPLSPGIT